MNVVGFQHVALAVNDLEAAHKFYVDDLGFHDIPRPEFGIPGAWLEAGRAQIHLFEMDTSPHASNHVALEVEDLDKVVAQLQERGVKVDAIPEMAGAGRQAFLRDPSGNQIELNQPS